MSSLSRFLLISIIAMFIAGCGDDDKKNILDRKNDPVAEEYHQKFIERFNKNNPFYLIASTKFAYYDTLKVIYIKRDFQPIVIKSIDDTTYLNEFLSILYGADSHGLNKDDYHFSLLKKELESIRINHEVNEKLYVNLSNAELLLSDGLLRYSSDLRFGVVNPTEVFPDFYFLPYPDSSKKELFEPLFRDDLTEYFKGIEPAGANYKKLQKSLAYYSGLLNATWRRIDGSFHRRMIEERLNILGFLDSSYFKSGKPDSVYSTAIVNFQKANGFNGDGDIDKPTLDKLNTPVLDYINKIKLSMERFRWAKYQETEKYVLVNIPEFYLHYIDNGSSKINIRVCTGKKRRADYDSRLRSYMKTRNWRIKPDDWETPQISGEISYLILNPTWTVPPSIVREEIYSESIKDSTYFLRKRFKVFMGGEEVDINDVDLSGYTANQVPYTFVQDPGDGNALGRIKFMFKNPFGIYLHDTPTRAPFSYVNRAVSHGCIRVEKPFNLAEYLLSQNSDWNIDYIKIETGKTVEDKNIIAQFRKEREKLRKGSSAGRTTQVKLNKTVPLFIDYYTAWVNDEGVLNLRDDVYGKDKILQKHLYNKN